MWRWWHISLPLGSFRCFRSYEEGEDGGGGGEEREEGGGKRERRGGEEREEGGGRRREGDTEEERVYRVEDKEKEGRGEIGERHIQMQNLLVCISIYKVHLLRKHQPQGKQATNSML